MLSFDTVHEYSMRDSHMYYCEDHEGLVIYKCDAGVDDQLRITGITPEAILMLARNFFCSNDPAFMSVKESDRDRNVLEIRNALKKYVDSKAKEAYEDSKDSDED